MAAPDARTTEETASSLPSVTQDETLIAPSKGDERATEQGGKGDLEGTRAILSEHKADERLAGDSAAGEARKEDVHASRDSNAHHGSPGDSFAGANGYDIPEENTSDTSKLESHSAIPTAHSSPQNESVDASSNPDGPVDADPPVQAPVPIPVSIQTTSAINRTSSPAYSQSSVTSGQGKDSSIVSTAPKKFSTVNINKKFLGKTGSGASPAQGSTTGVTASKEGGLGLVNLSGKSDTSLLRCLYKH